MENCRTRIKRPAKYLQMRDILKTLTAIIQSRKNAAPASSYVAMLLDKGQDAILKKIGEEATELVMASKDASVSGATDKVVAEATDLLFHMMVALAHHDRKIDDVLMELERREGVSGIVEKLQRKEP